MRANGAKTHRHAKSGVHRFRGLDSSMQTNTSLLVRIVVVGLVLWGVFARAQETKRFATFHTYVGRPIPNVDLPKQVPAPKGELTLFADYAAADKDGVPLYLINRTDRIASFPAQDGDIYLKLEHRLSDGTWERAQSHAYSNCGNSSMGGGRLSN